MSRIEMHRMHEYECSCLLCSKYVAYTIESRVMSHVTYLNESRVMRYVAHRNASNARARMPVSLMFEVCRIYD